MRLPHADFGESGKNFIGIGKHTPVWETILVVTRKHAVDRTFVAQEE